MESQQPSSYKSLKTAKTFINSLLASFAKKDGDKLYRQLRQLYFTDHYLSIPEKSWNISVSQDFYHEYEPKYGRSFAKVLQFVRDFAAERAGGNWTKAFAKQMQALKAIIRVLQDMNEYIQWISKPLRIIVRATKRIFLTASKQTNSVISSKLKSDLLNTIQRFKSARSLQDDIKRQFLSLIDVMQNSILLFYHNYEQVQRIIYSPKMYGNIGERYLDNFLFQKGKYALVNQNLKEAEECLSTIKIRSKNQKKMVLRYLIPCKMLLGIMFRPKDQIEKEEYHQYLSLSQSIITSDFQNYQFLNQRYQKLWLKRGIYLLMDRVRIILWRNLIKRLTVLYGYKIQMQVIQKAVHLRGGTEDINECICIVGNLIYQGYIKGYIFQNQIKKTLVIKSNGNAFPKLSTISKA